MRRESSSWDFRTTSRRFARCFCRSFGLRAPQWRNAFRAAATAASISSGPARWISASLSPVAGFRVKNVFPVATSRPSMIGPAGRARPFFKSSPPA